MTREIIYLIFIFQRVHIARKPDYEFRSEMLLEFNEWNMVCMVSGRSQSKYIHSIDRPASRRPHTVNKRVNRALPRFRPPQMIQFSNLPPYVSMYLCILSMYFIISAIFCRSETEKEKYHVRVKPRLQSQEESHLAFNIMWREMI